MARRKKTRRSLARLYRRPDRPGGMYYIDYWKGDERVRRSLKTTDYETAKERRDAVITGKVKAEWGEAPLPAVGLDVLWTQYREAVKADIAPVTLKTYGHHWKAFKAAVSRTNVADVTEDDIVRFKNHRKDQGRGYRTINDGLNFLSTLFDYAVKHGLHRGPNPVKDVERAKKVKNTPKFLDAAQIDLLLAVAKTRHTDIYLFCALCVYAGLRTNEAVNCRWEWIRFEDGSIHVPAVDLAFQAKDADARSIPLHSKLRTILEPYRKATGYVILPDKKEAGAWRIRYEPKRAFNTVLRHMAAHLIAAATDRGETLDPAPDFSWISPHVLRHTFASRLAQEGVSLFKIGQWLGHANPATTTIYAHLQPRDPDIDRF